MQLATHALCVYQCVCLVRLWDTRSCLVKTRSQRVNGHTKPQPPPRQNCRCSGISEASRRSGRNRRSPGPFREQQVAFYLSVSVASSRFDNLMRTSRLRANESPFPPLRVAFTPDRAHLSFRRSALYKKNKNKTLACPFRQRAFFFQMRTRNQQRGANHIREPRRH